MNRLKIFITVMGLSMIISCKKNTVEAGLAEETPKLHNQKGATGETNSVADLTITAGMTLAQMNEVIAAATAGQTVWVEAGTYSITGKINMKAGVTLAKKTTTNPVFDATATTAQLLTLTYTTDMSKSSFSGITFWNIRFVLNGSVKPAFKYCIFDYGVRPSGTDESYYSDAYIQLSATDSAAVTNCVFSRRVNNSGRGVWVKSGTTNSKIASCSFGNGGTTGYFVTAINDNSQSNSLIDGNTINRNTALNSDALQTDHGIYAHSFNGLVISNNTITGWPADASGGAIKARNGQNLTISGNTLNTSGILLYEYANTPDYPYLNNVKILNNTINIASAVNDIYHGIAYYKDNTTGTEYSIRVEGNILPNGTISFSGSNIDVASFNADNGGVYNNDYGLIALKSGINQSGNY